ncbi:MAG TPA: hypothetical protein VIW29_09095, partial [Polyangiaceae bacterium]
VAREAVTLGLRARAAAKVKLRQPLHEAVVVAAGVERDAIVRLLWRPTLAFCPSDLPVKKSRALRGDLVTIRQFLQEKLQGGSPSLMT